MRPLPSFENRRPLRPLARPSEPEEAAGAQTVEALELQYVERLLGRRPTAADARLLPGIDLSRLLHSKRSH